VKIASNNFCGNRIFMMNIQFCCLLCCSSSVIFATVLLNTWGRSISFCQCWFSSAVPLRWCFKIGQVSQFPILTHGLSLNAISNVAITILDIIYLVSVSGHQQQQTQRLATSIGPNWVSSNWRRRQNPVPETLCFKLRQSLTPALQNVNKDNKNIQCRELEFFHCSQLKQNLLLFLAFQSFYAPPSTHPCT
jgi:hypothetical protein